MDFSGFCSLLDLPFVIGTIFRFHLNLDHFIATCIKIYIPAS